ncbi:hypothetical protein PPROV_000645700 [Pycnococcus provasolii]|uniref:Large ribosomal subunit protein bL31c n=1 Tax=Pycnococcus provasolii TaxID=41880 RepID=A0A830HM80_9CHLO|nr:hypothetical protein PPROV_000645700 [Pycnococcus provasolii]
MARRRQHAALNGCEPAMFEKPEMRYTFVSKLPNYEVAQLTLLANSTKRATSTRSPASTTLRHNILNKIVVACTDGSSILMNSTTKRPIPYVLRRDPFNHPSWTGAIGQVQETESVSKFRSRFGDAGFMQTKQ